MKNEVGQNSNTPQEPLESLLEYQKYKNINLKQF
jgi:hypothetical protein